MAAEDFSTGVASQCLGDGMASMHRNTAVTTKLSVVCGWPLVGCKKWVRGLVNVKYSAARCRAATSRLVIQT